MKHILPAMRHTLPVFLAVCLIVAFFGCGGGGGQRDAGSDRAPGVITDAAGDTANDMASDPGPGDDVVTDAGTDQASDTVDAVDGDIASDPGSVGDAVADASADAVPDGSLGDLPGADPCQGIDFPPPPTPIVADQKRFGLAIYHFNMQYVAGGLKGALPGDADGLLALDNDQVEDRIVTQSLEPLLDMYLNHPTWGADIELQGYMLDVMMRRHPRALAKLRLLASRGQLAVESFHWSDQLWVAYPAPAMEMSFARNQRSFEAACIPWAPVTFTQEGQFSESMAAFGLPRGLNAVVLPKNLLRHFHGEPSFIPAYRNGEQVVVVGGKGGNDATSGIGVVWTFLNDGELALTNRGNPYLGLAFEFKPESLVKREKELGDLEAQGFRHVRVSDYVQVLRDRGIALPALPPMPDGTWQPKQTANVGRWMGRRGAFSKTEDDNTVTTGNVALLHRLQAAEVLLDRLDELGASTPADMARHRADLARARDAALLAEVSDATGWNPIINEVRYGIDHITEGNKMLDQLFGDVLAGQGWSTVDIDTDPKTPAAARVTHDAPSPLAPEPPPVEPLFDVDLLAQGFTVQAKWFSLAGPTAGARLVLTFTPDETVTSNPFQQVRLPFDTDVLSWTPALDMETFREVPLADFSFEQKEACQALPNGLIRIGPERFLIEETEQVHLAACLEPATGTLRVRNEVAPRDRTHRWAFRILEGTDVQTALAAARRLNVYPVVREERP